MTITFVDTGVLIAAVRGDGDACRRAFAILDDPTREFASSLFVRLEALPMPTYHRRSNEVAFLETFFAGVVHWPNPRIDLVESAMAEASQAGLSALDALHVAAAHAVGASELVTTEKRRRSLHRVASLTVVTI